MGRFTFKRRAGFWISPGRGRGLFALKPSRTWCAEVIRIECTLRPWCHRMIPPLRRHQPGPNRAGYFNQYNQASRSILLDLSSPKP